MSPPNSSHSVCLLACPPSPSQAWREAIANPSNYARYTLGWDTTTYKGHQRWAHNGGTDSFGTEVNFFPGLKYGVVTFANTALSSNAIGEILSYKLIDDRLGVPPEKRGKWEEE